MTSTTKVNAVKNSNLRSEKESNARETTTEGNATPILDEDTAPGTKPPSRWTRNLKPRGNAVPPLQSPGGPQTGGKGAVK